MKQNEVHVGVEYVAKVSGKLVRVRVDAIRKIESYHYNRSSGRYRTIREVYDVTNLDTGRKLTFRSAMKFRHRAMTEAQREEVRRERKKAEQ